MSLRIALLALLLALSGCALDGVLELSIQAPAADSTRNVNFLFVQVRPEVDDFPFDDSWRSPNDIGAIALGNASSVEPVSVVSDLEGTNLRIKLTLCATAACSELGDEFGQVWYLIESPIYIGARTSAELIIPPLMDLDGQTSVPTTTIERCDVVGCVDGELSSYCRRDDRHLCE